MLLPPLATTPSSLLLLLLLLLLLSGSGLSVPVSHRDSTRFKVG
jgi:hypothetical protein